MAHAAQIKIPATYMRGGTSKGVCFSLTDLPESARGRGLDAHRADGEALDFGPEFDAVFSNAALHWMPNADAVAAGVFRALKPGGRFVAEFGGFANCAAIVTAFQCVARTRSLPATTNGPSTPAGGRSSWPTVAGSG